MKTRFLIWLIASTLGTASAHAQDALSAQAPPTTRAPGSHGEQRAERLLDLVEKHSALLAPRDGFGVRVSGIEGGSGFAAGPRWQNSALLGGRARVHASVAASITREHEIEGGVTVEDVGTHAVTIRLGAVARHLADERFAGFGAGSIRADQTSFALDQREASAAAIVAPARWLRLTGGAGIVTAEARSGRARRLPGTFDRWEAGTLPGLTDHARFATFSLGAVADRRDVPGNPRQGGRYAVSLERYVDRGRSLQSFRRTSVELEQHFSWWRKQRVLTLRTLGVLSHPDRGHEVPFHLQPTLGGSRVLRGFVNDRFRDRHMAVVQAEYAWDVWPFLNAVLFYEAGTVARELRDMTSRSVKSDYGIGFRLGSARTIVARTDVAFGSGEGVRLAMRFSHAF